MTDEAPPASGVTALSHELESIDGIVAAEVEIDPAGAPTTVRVRLSPDADSTSVGTLVQQLLAAHGVRSRLDEEPADADRPNEQSGAPADRVEAEIGRAEDRAGTADLDRRGPERDGPPPPPGAPGQVVPLEVAGAARRSGIAAAVTRVDRRPEARSVRPTPPTTSVPPGTVIDTVLRGVSVEESREGVVVVVAAEDGRRAERLVSAAVVGVEEAVVQAVGRLFGLAAAPAMVGIQDGAIDGTPVLTVVVEVPDGRRLTGSAVVEAGRPFAVAQAAWAALEGLA